MLHILALCITVLFPQTTVASAQSVDDIVAKNLQAKGGIDVIRQTTSVKMTGTFKTYPPQGPPIEMQMTTWAKRPNLMRSEATFIPPSPPAGQPPAPARRRTRVQASDGSNVWLQFDQNPPQTLPKADADPAMKGAEFDSVFVDYAKRGIKIQLVGRETLKGRPVYHLQVSRARYPDEHYYLDAETGLEVKFTTEASQGGSTAKVETESSDFRNVNGRMMPFKTRQLVNGQLSAEMTIETVEFNVEMPESLFKMPAVK